MTTAAAVRGGRAGRAHLLGGAGPAAAGRARAGLDPDQPTSPTRPATRRSNGTLEPMLKLALEGAGLHQRLRPHRHPPQPRRRAARAARRGRRPDDCRQAGRRRRAVGHRSRRTAAATASPSRPARASPATSSSTRRAVPPARTRCWRCATDARQPRPHGPRRRHLRLGAALRHRDAVGHLARRRARVRHGDAGAVEQQVRRRAAELRPRRQARPELRPGLRRHGDRLVQHGPAAGSGDLRAGGHPPRRQDDRARALPHARHVLLHHQRLRGLRQGVRRPARPLRGRRRRAQQPRAVLDQAARHDPGP